MLQALACPPKAFFCLYFRRRGIFLVRRDGPGEAEGIFHMAVAVAPKLIGEGGSDRAARGDCFRKSGIRVRHIEVHDDRPVPFGNRR